MAETISTPRRRLPQHRHQCVEVLTHVIEGSGTYEYGSSTPELIGQGDTRLLTAPDPVSHAINPGKGQTIRYFAIVASLPAGKMPEVGLQSARSAESAVLPDGTSVARLVGPGSGIQSGVGLESERIRFHSEGTSFRMVGHGHLAICYALAGEGAVDSQSLQGGEAAFIDEASGIALQGNPGFRVIFLRVPRDSSPPG
ncbi:MAG: hypothetical protein WB947_08355 [Thermoplasmata archaeon]